MKKLVLFLMVVLLVSCSRDQQIVDTTLEKEYYKMINSKDFKSFEIKVNDFLDKSEIENNSVFQSEISTKKYLNENIGKTKFSSIESASKSYTELKELHLKIFKDNEMFFKILLNSEKEEIDEILNQISESKFTTTIKKTKNTAKIQGNCTFGCINDAVYCDRMSNANLRDTFGVSAVAFYTGNPFGAAATAFAGWLSHYRAQGACVRTLEKCKSQCPE